MEMGRLIGILSVLLQEEKATALELTERFRVSKGTTNRDIESLCKAGIPIHTAQETDGNISITDGYRMDRAVLTSKDMQMIPAGLRSSDGVSGSGYCRQPVEKIQARPSAFIVDRDFLLMDLSSRYRDLLVPKMEIIQGATGGGYLIKFRHYVPSGESEQTLEPYYLVF